MMSFMSIRPTAASAEVTLSDRGATFILRRPASHFLQSSEVLTLRFRSLADLRSQVTRLIRRARQPHQSLTSVPWPQCWPPYRASERSRAFFLGTLRSHERDWHRCRQGFTFVLLPGEALICIERWLGDSILLLPADFLDSISLPGRE